MMMNAGRMSKAAARVARVAVNKSESSVQRSVSASLQMSTRAGLGLIQGANKLPTVQGVTRFPAVMQIPMRQMSGSTTPEQKEVEAATMNWVNTVTLNTDDAPKKTAALYADDALFWGTVSEQLRSTPTHFYDYFDMFARLPKLSMVAYDPEPPVVHGSCAVHAGAYTFAWEVDGAMKETRARFTFVHRKDPSGWIIVEHHSSAMPTAPPSLKPAA